MDQTPLHWIVGIENALIPDMGVDELTWTAHRSRWREDLALAREAGASLIRYGITWPELNPSPGRFEWRWCDEVVSELDRLALEPVWDLIHFGTPPWISEGFLDPGYVEAVGRFCRAFATRYRGHVSRYTPLNEPYISTYFRAGWGIWPPHLHGRAGFARMLRPIIEGLRASIRSITEADPAARIWLNDGADTFHPATPDLAEEAARRTVERYAPLDILLGLARPGQETYEWLVEAGYPATAMAGEPVQIDVIGLDYYPNTEQELYGTSPGATLTRPAPHPIGVAETMRLYHRRYGKPLFIAESSCEGTEIERQRWLDWNVAAIRSVRAEGIRCIGYTWWPLFDHVDWNSLLRERTGHVCPGGLYHAAPNRADRQPTATLERFRKYATGQL